MLSEELKAFDEKQKEAREVLESIKDISCMGDLFIGLLNSKTVYLSENYFNILKNTFDECKEYLDTKMNPRVSLSKNIFEPKMQIILEKVQKGPDGEIHYFLKQLISPGINLLYKKEDFEKGIVIN